MEAGLLTEPRVLWVTAEPPDRTLRGGSIRQAHLFEALARALPVDLLLAGELRDEAIRAAAQTITEVESHRAMMPADAVLRRAVELGVTLGSRYPLPVYLEGPARRRLDRALQTLTTRYRLICVEHAALAPLIRPSWRTRWLITFHHLLSGMIESEAVLAPGRRQRWFRERDARKARRLEADAAGVYDRCVVCSDDDASVLNALAGTSATGRVSVIPNGVELSQFRPVPLPGQHRLLFPGTFSYTPNVDGALWFCAEIWPRVRAAVPDAELVLAGRAPVEEVLMLGELPGVSIHPDVPSMIPYFESARAVVVPLRIGTGTRIKALEAMAAGRPVVGTPHGLAGLGIQDGVHAWVAEDADRFAGGVVETLLNDDLAAALSAAGRAHVEDRFGWDRIGPRFVALAAELVGEGQRDGSIAS